MAASCVLTPHVKRPDGTVHESTLFKDLQKHFNGKRSLAKEYYFSAINETFVDTVRDKAEFDDNGEITFKSLSEIVDLDDENLKILDRLNHEIGAGEYEFIVASSKVKHFNTTSKYRGRYFAIMKKTKNGQYKVEVVKKSKNVIADYIRTIKNKVVSDRLIKRLNDLGVNVEYLRREANFDGRYSTENVEKTLEGLYTLITISKNGEYNIALAHEAGHFALAALNNEELVQRLISAMSGGVADRIMSQFPDRITGNDKNREVAGILVGEALMHQLDPNPITRLANRIATMAKRLFAKISRNEIEDHILDARDAADEIARNFISSSAEFSVDKALETKETLWQAEKTEAQQLIINTVKKLRELSENLSTFADKRIQAVLAPITQQLELMTNDSVNIKDTEAGVLTNSVIFSNLTEALLALIQELDNDTILLKNFNSIDPFNTDEYFTHMPQNAKAIRTVQTVAYNLLSIAKSLGGDNVPDVSFTISGYEKPVSIKEQIKKLNTMAQDLYDAANNKSTDFWVGFATQFYGSSEITMQAMRTILNPLKRDKDGKIVGMSEALREDMMRDFELKVQNRIGKFDTDLNLYEAWLKNIDNIDETVSQVAAMTIKTQKHVANNGTNEVWDQLKVLYAKWRELGRSAREMSMFYERDEKGNLTGDFISDKRYSEWEKERDKYRAELKKEFVESMEYTDVDGTKKNHLDNKSETWRAVKFDMYARKKWIDWHAENSKKNEAGYWVPNEKYNNPNYEKLKEMYPKEFEIFEEMMNIKRQLDDMVGAHHTMNHRAPQFKGTLFNRISNDMNGKAWYMWPATFVKHALRKYIWENFVMTSEDTDYGSNSTYNNPFGDFNEEHQDPFRWEDTKYTPEPMNRLPLYGINKLKDTSELSTDLFQSLLAYAGMANTYSAMKNTVDILEIGRNAIKNKKRGGSPDYEKMVQTKLYNRYAKYLDKQVYGIGYSASFKGTSELLKLGPIIISKAIKTFANFAGFVYLGGNIQSGAINTGTGFIENFKEGVVGEHFGMSDWAFAHKVYFGSLFSSVGDLCFDATSKRDLFLRRFNNRDKNETEYRTWHKREQFWQKLLGKLTYLPFSTGDHYMQAIPYIAMAHATKLYDIDTLEETNVYEAYEKEANAIETDKGTIKSKRGGSHLELKGTYLKDPDDRDKYFMIKEIQRKIKEFQEEQKNNKSTLSILGAKLDLTEEEQEFLNENNIDINKLKSASYKLEELSHDMIWTLEDEARFQMRAREVSNRMHGIYNKQDGVMLQQNAYGEAFLSMKMWAVGGLIRRFDKGHYSATLGKEVEGSVVSSFKILSNTLLEAIGYFQTGDSSEGFKSIGRMMYNFIPIGKTYSRIMRNAGYTDNQIGNARRHALDMYFTLALKTCQTLCMFFGGVEPEGLFAELLLRILGLKNNTKYYKYKKGEYIFKKTEWLANQNRKNGKNKNFSKGRDDTSLDHDWLLGIGAFVACRLASEQSTLTAALISNDYKPLINLAPAGVTAFADLLEVPFLAVGSMFVDESNSMFYYQEDKPGHHKEGEAKWKYALIKKIPYYKSVYPLKHPWEALKSFEYFRRVNAKT